MINFNEIYTYCDGNLFGTNNKIPLGSYDKDGYLILCRDSKQYKAHRVIWEMHYGEIPEGMVIDHINRVRDDNRIENLRIVDKTLNNENRCFYNRKCDKDNKLGIRGVCKQGSGFLSYICHKGFKKHKYFKTLEEAAEQRKQGEKEFYK